MSHIPLVTDWGDVPTWVGALTTLGALIAAGVVVKIEMRRDAREEKRRERAEQADLVAVWHEEGSGPPRIVLRNGSNLPIYNVLVFVIHEQHGEMLIQLDTPIPPGDQQVRYPSEVLAIASDTDIQVAFTDTAGRSWQRWFDGRLTPLRDEYARTTFVPAESRTDVVPPEGGEQPPL